MIGTIAIIAAFFGSLLAGLFGGGAGLILTPTLYILLSYSNSHSNGIMQTSITTMIASLMLSGAIGVYKHAKYDHIDWDTVRWSAPLVMIGSGLGCMTMTQLSSQKMVVIFSIATLFLAFKSTYELLKKSSKMKMGKKRHNFFSKYIGSVLLGIISTLSGAASFSVPYYEHLGLTIKKSIGTTTIVIWLYSTVLLVYMIISGWNVKNLPSYNIGYLNFYYFLIFLIPTIPGTILGARLAHTLPSNMIKKYFTILLYVIAISMLVM